MVAFNNEKLTRAIEQQQLADQAAAKQAQKVRELALAEMVRQDPQCVELAQQEACIRKQLHRNRLHQGRTRFSIRVQSKKLALTQADLGLRQEQERELAKELEFLLAAQESARKALQGSICKQRAGVAVCI